MINLIPIIASDLKFQRQKETNDNEEVMEAVSEDGGDATTGTRFGASSMQVSER